MQIWKDHPSIAHYTSLPVVIEILKSKVLHASRFDRMNDKSEIIFAKKILTNAIFEKFKKINKTLTFENVHHKIDDMYRVLGREIYIISCSRINLTDVLNEDDGILSMWRYYAKDDGCYIEFDTELIWQFPEIFKKSTGRARVFADAIYSINDNKANDLAKRCADELEMMLKNFAIEDINDISEISDEDILPPLFELVSSYKHPAFSDEREVRLSILNSMPTRRNENTFDVSKNDIGEPFIRYPFSPKAVKKIVIGPSENQNKIIEDIELFLAKTPEYSHVKVAKSTIPVVMHKR